VISKAHPWRPSGIHYTKSAPFATSDPVGRMAAAEIARIDAEQSERRAWRTAYVCAGAFVVALFALIYVIAR
jgi:hypothetical protein